MLLSFVFLCQYFINLLLSFLPVQHIPNGARLTELAYLPIQPNPAPWVP